jgi:hypothetical protein
MVNKEKNRRGKGGKSLVVTKKRYSGGTAVRQIFPIKHNDFIK